MNEYEVTDLFEAGEAGTTIQAKINPITPDEVGGFLGPEEGVYEEE